MILVTGSTGYLGSSLVSFLNKKKLKISAANRNYQFNSKDRNNLNHIYLNILNKKDINLSLNKVSTVIHLVALNHSECESNSSLAYRVNVEGTINLCKAAIKKKIEKFIFFSTVHVYGSDLDGKINEKFAPKPNSIYSLTHLKAENEIINLCKGTKTKPIILRISNIVGPPLNKSINCWMLVINDFCKQARMNEKIQINSSGIQKRDFVSINDLNTIVYKIIKLKNNETENIYNVTSQNLVSIIYLAKLIKKKILKKYGVSIKILVKKNIKKENFKKYIIENKKILSSKYIDQFNSIDREIDNVIEFCWKNF